MSILTGQTWLCNRKGGEAALDARPWNETAEVQKKVEAVKKAQNAPKPPSTEKPEAESTLAKKMTELVDAVKMAVEGIEESGCLDKVNWCTAYQKKERAPSTYSSWTDYVERGCGKKQEGPAVHLHGHHIVLKGDRYTENAAARRILCKHGINPYTGCENLAITRNWCHSEKYAQHVLAELTDADSEGRASVVARLGKLALRHHNCSWPGPGSGHTGPEPEVSETTDELP